MKSNIIDSPSNAFRTQGSLSKFRILKRLDLQVWHQHSMLIVLKQNIQELTFHSKILSQNFLFFREKFDANTFEREMQHLKISRRLGEYLSTQEFDEDMVDEQNLYF